MPSIRDAVLKGPLNETERKIFEVLTAHPDHIFSTSVEDLAELAAWCMEPGSDEPPEIAKTPGETLSINDRIRVWANGHATKQEAPCTLRTVSVALASLAKTNRIWSGKLHFQSLRGEDSGEDPKAAGRTYYGEKQADLRLADVLEELNGESRAIGRFTTIKPDGEAEESKREADTVEEVLASLRPKIVALCRQASRTEKDLHSLRVPDEESGFIFQDVKIDPTWQAMPRLMGTLTFESLLAYSRIRSPIMELGNQLVGLGRASVRVGPAYRNAKWGATFFEVTGMVAQSIDTWLDSRGISLESAGRLLELFNLLGKKPVPSFGDFVAAGITKEELMAQLDTARINGILTFGGRNQGSAFSMQDQSQASYDQLVLAPAFEKVVDDLIS